MQNTSSTYQNNSFGAYLTSKNTVSNQRINYIYAFNGMERDDEVKGRGNNYDYVHRFYDARLGRFLSIDDLTYKFPWYSPYQFAGNKVIRCIDLDGEEELDMIVTSDPNTTSGEPGVAHLTISKDYTVVTSGFGAVTSSEKIINSEFSQSYSKGNVTLFVSELPSPNNDAVYLDEQNVKLARKALEGDNTAKQELKNKGVNYYVLTVAYNYTISVNKDVTLCQAYDEMITNPARNGVVAMSMKPPSSYLHDLLGDPIYEQLAQGVLSGYRILKNDKNAGGAGLTASYNKFDFIFLNPNTWNNDNAFDVIKSGDPYYSKYYSRTEAIVHEAGHNSTDLGHKEGYDYTDIGLSSNQQGAVSPTHKNTKQIISSERNRSNMKISKPKY